jgi:hypothetical protein
MAASIPFCKTNVLSVGSQTAAFPQKLGLSEAADLPLTRAEEKKSQLGISQALQRWLFHKQEV